MSKYRKVDTRIWNDGKFAGLSVQGKLAFMFILTHPHMTALGGMRASIPGLVAELPGVTEKAFREALAKGLFRIDEKACFVWLPNFLKYNPPESPNVVKSWSQAFDLLPECEMKNELIERVKDFLEGFAEGFRKALAKALPKTMPNQEQEQELEQEYPPPNPPLAGGCVELPDWVDQKTWDEFAEMRKKLRAPITNGAKTRLIASLERLRAAGHDPNACLGQSIERSWRGVFEIKPGSCTAEPEYRRKIRQQKSLEDACN